jgi:hypothetical protein
MPLQAQGFVISGDMIMFLTTDERGQQDINGR